MATATGNDVGQLLRQWRERRRITQMELALDAGVSARHLSFVETGRSKPGRELLLRLAEQLDLPYREQNHLLLVAGHAPAFPERSLDDPALAPVRQALDGVLAAHEPYPAIAFDRGWNLVAANRGAGAVFGATEVDPELIKPPVNLLRLGLHPRGLGPRIVNYEHWRGHFARRLSAQIAIIGDSELNELLEEILAYPGGSEDDVDRDADSGVLGPVRLHAPGGGEWAFFGMFAGFDTPFEVTSSELAFELLFPADRSTEEAIRKGAS
jgi:transcriptional regulator with XRE-family HTH domain